MTPVTPEDPQTKIARLEAALLAAQTQKRMNMLWLTSNWKPKLIGALTFVVAMLQAFQLAGETVIQIDPKLLSTIMLFAVTSLAFVTKQHNQTGGTVGVPSTPQALVDSNSAPATGAAAPIGPPPVAPSGK